MQMCSRRASLQNGGAQPHDNHQIEKGGTGAGT